MKLETLKKEVWRASRWLRDMDSVLSSLGSVSGIDREQDLLVVTPSGIPDGELEIEHMVVVDLNGQVLEGSLTPSSDTLTHLVLYRHFPEIGGVAHTHSSFACVWAQAGLGIPALGATHAAYFWGEIPCTRALTTEEIRGNYARSIGEVIVRQFRHLDYREVPGVLVAYHGPFTWGKDSWEAVHHSVVLEEVAKTALFTRFLRPEQKPLPLSLLERCFFLERGQKTRAFFSSVYRTVKTASNRVEAELIRGYLEAEGIAVILKPSTFPYGGEAYFGDTGPFEIQVPEEKLSEAQRIIADLEASSDA